MVFKAYVSTPPETADDLFNALCKVTSRPAEDASEGGRAIETNQD
jgi:hypothetical protein